MPKKNGLDLLQLLSVRVAPRGRASESSQKCCKGAELEYFSMNGSLTLLQNNRLYDGR